MSMLTPALWMYIGKQLNKVKNINLAYSILYNIDFLLKTSILPLWLFMLLIFLIH